MLNSCAPPQNRFKEVARVSNRLPDHHDGRVFQVSCRALDLEGGKLVSPVKPSFVRLKVPPPRPTVACIHHSTGR